MKIHQHNRTIDKIERRRLMAKRLAKPVIIEVMASLLIGPPIDLNSAMRGARS